MAPPASAPAAAFAPDRDHPRVERIAAIRLHPLHAVLLAFPVAFFPAALLADVTYLNSAEMQWSNIAAWAITGALVVGGPALAWALLASLRGRVRGGRARGRWVYPLLLGLAWVAGLVNAFQHSRDGWASVGAAGLMLSIVSTVAVLAAAWFAYSGGIVRETVR